MSDAPLTDAQARKAFKWSLIASILVGILAGYCAYGDLLDMRAWNVIGLVVIFGVGGWAAVLGIMAWLKGMQPDEEAGAS